MSPNNQNFRRDKRVTFTMQARLATGSGGESPVQDVSVLDLSESGLRVRVCGLIVPGQVVDVFLNKRPERCRVVWTSPVGPNTELIAGLEFTYSLPEPTDDQTPPATNVGPVN